jgi:hypothetical protein
MAVVLGIAALSGASTAIAHSSSPSVNHALAIMRSTTLTEAQKEAKVGALMANMDSAAAAKFVNSLLVTGGTTSNGAALSTALSATLVAIAKSSTNVALQGAIGIGMGRAAATMSAAGYTSASANISGAANSSGLTILTKALTVGIQQGNNTTIFTLVISPAQACRSSC